MKVVSFRSFRILLLLGLLAAAVIYTQSQRLASQDWYTPLPVYIYPINGDDSASVDNYIATLTPNKFGAINRFLEREATRYQLHASPLIELHLEPRRHVLPPPRPEPGANPLSIALWSFQLRYWAWQQGADTAAAPHVDLFVIYHDGIPGRRLAHSLGLQKGLVGVVHAFADSASTWQNNIVITHELLHTVGATDKYGADGEPIFPDGYGDPQQTPRYPQERAEIMAGKRALSANQSSMAESLGQCVAGERTAREINWLYTEH